MKPDDQLSARSKIAKRFLAIDLEYELSFPVSFAMLMEQLDDPKYPLRETMRIALGLQSGDEINANLQTILPWVAKLTNEPAFFSITEHGRYTYRNPETNDFFSSRQMMKLFERSVQKQKK